MSTSETPTRPWLGLVITVGVVGMLLLPRFLPIEMASDSEPGILAAVVMVAVISGFLVAKRPRHPVSWLLTGAAIAGGVAGLSADVLPAGLTDPAPWQMWLAIISGPAWYGLLVTVLVLIPLLFPTGAPPSPRWRWLGIGAGAAVFAFSVPWMLQERFCTGWSTGADEICISSLANPIGIPGLQNPEESSLGGALYVILLLAAVGALVSLILRFRRSGQVERKQVKWVAFSVGLFIAFSLLVEAIWIGLLDRAELPAYSLIQQVLWVMIPVSIAVAILRYRLYEIDRIVSRTVSYAVIALILGAVWVGGLLALQTILPASGDLAVATSTLVAAALFSPLRQRVRVWVDRRFNRSRYDAGLIFEAFTSRLRDAVDLPTATNDLIAVVRATVEPTTASVWVRGE